MKKTASIGCLILTFFFLYFLQSNFFTWFNIAGIMPNIYIIYILFIGLFVKKKIGLIFGLACGLYIDVLLGSSVGISALGLGIIGIIGEYLSKNFSKDSRFIIVLMVAITTIIYEALSYGLLIARTSAASEILSFIKILFVEVVFNCLITIIIYPLIKKAGYYLENIFDDKIILTRYF